MDGDEDALHFGVLEGDQLHCVASLYINGQSARLRKFATIQQAQGKGLGSFMLNFLIEHLRKSEVKRFWFDARESALDFYRRFGFSVEDTRFYKNDVAYFRMYMDW